MTSRRDVDRLNALARVADAAREADLARLSAVMTHVVALRARARVLRGMAKEIVHATTASEMIAGEAWRRNCKRRADDAEVAATRIEQEAQSLRKALSRSFGRSEAAHDLLDRSRSDLARAAERRAETVPGQRRQSRPSEDGASSDGIA